MQCIEVDGKLLLQRCLYLKTLDGADERKQCCAQYLSQSKLRIVICTRFTGFSSIVGILGMLLGVLRFGRPLSL